MINECTCGCGNAMNACSKMTSDKPRSYMFFGNLKTMHRAIEKLMQLDPEKVDHILNNGHDWANDHIATSKDDVQEVMEFFLNEMMESPSNTNHSTISSFIKTFESFNEMKASTYAKLMNRTENYPWTQYVSGEDSPKSRGKKMERVNSLARERFIDSFLEEFPLYDTLIDAESGTFAFTSIRFNTNYTNYSLFFNNVETNESLVVDLDPGKGYMLNDESVVLSRQSENLLNQMMRFQTKFLM